MCVRASLHELFQLHLEIETFKIFVHATADSNSRLQVLFFDGFEATTNYLDRPGDRMFASLTAKKAARIER